MDSNPYESPGEVNDQLPPPLHSEVRQIYYSLGVSVVSAIYLLWVLPQMPWNDALPVHEVLLFTTAIGGAIVGPIFCTLALIRWLVNK